MIDGLIKSIGNCIYVGVGVINGKWLINEKFCVFEIEVLE